MICDVLRRIVSGLSAASVAAKCHFPTFYQLRPNFLCFAKSELFGIGVKRHGDVFADFYQSKSKRYALSQMVS